MSYDELVNGYRTLFTRLYTFDAIGDRWLAEFHAMTGLWCPGCGGLRAVHDLTHGHLVTALHENALVVLLGDQMDGGTGFPVTRGQYRFVHLPAIHAGAAVLGQQRGMNVDDASPIGRHDLGRHQLDVDGVPGVAYDRNGPGPVVAFEGAQKGRKVASPPGNRDRDSVGHGAKTNWSPSFFGALAACTFCHASSSMR